MTPVEPTKLTVYRGDNKEFESEGFYEVQVFSTDDGAMVFDSKERRSHESV